MSLVSHATVRMDGNIFEGITFDHCRMYYAGGPWHTVHCTFRECLWIFDGPAGDTLKLLALVYWERGGAKMVEDTFRSIRLGAFPDYDDINAEKRRN